MKTLLLSSALAMAGFAAMAQDATTLTVDGIVYDVLPYDARETYGVDLAPGEEIVEFYAAPSIVRMPLEAEILYETDPYDPVDIDRVTGLPRNTAGWTGESEEPLGIGCFPQGVCTSLND